MEASLQPARQLPAEPGTGPQAIAERLRPASVRPLRRVAPRRAELVVVTQDSLAQLARSLRPIADAAGRAGANLLFIDLGSTDGTRSFIERHAPGARGVWLDHADGMATVLSAACACSEAEVLVLLTPELRPASTDALALLLEQLEQHPCASAAAPLIRRRDGDVVRSAGAIPNARTALFGGAWPPASARGREPSCVPGCWQRFERVEWAQWQGLAIRRAALEEIKPIEAGPVAPWWTLDVCARLLRRGTEIHYVPGAELLDAGAHGARRTRPGLSPPLDLPLLGWLCRHPRYALRRMRPSFLGRALSRALARGLDVVAACALLIALAPLLGAIALAITLDSPGPVLFRQRRLGRGARPFEMFKFRTMQHGADPRPHEEYVREMILNGRPGGAGPGGQIFKLHPDPRVTRVGRLLRRLSLDELPQLLNVLRGEMTLVGFRPPIPYEVSHYPDWYFRRFDSRPGLTGLWQVSGRNERTYEEMVSLDIEYINRRSRLLDVQLLARTLGAILSGRGAY